MEVGHFYYIEDSYFVDFPDPYLMRNKASKVLALQRKGLRLIFPNVLEIESKLMSQEPNIFGRVSRIFETMKTDGFD